jgi:hypothetical protein
MMYLVTLYVKSGAAVVDKIVMNLKNANLRKEAFLDKRRLERKMVSTDSMAYTEHHLTTYTQAMDEIEKKKVSFDMEFINFIVHGHLRNYFVQLFPIRYRSGAAVTIMC